MTAAANTSSSTPFAECSAIGKEQPLQSSPSDDYQWCQNVSSRPGRGNPVPHPYSHGLNSILLNARLSSAYSWYTGVRSQFPNVAWNIKLKIKCRNDQAQQHRLYQLPFVLIMINNNIFKEWCHLIGIDHQPAANNGAEGSYYSW